MPCWSAGSRTIVVLADRLALVSHSATRVAARTGSAPWAWLTWVARKRSTCSRTRWCSASSARNSAALRVSPAHWGQRWSFELTPDGPDATVVTEIFDCSRVPEDQREDIDNGNIWIEDMRRTLERLDRLCTS